MAPVLLKLLFLAKAAFVVVAEVRADGKPDGGAKNPFGNMPGFGDNSCPLFKCSNDQVPVPKERIQFTSLGCSAMGGAMNMMVSTGSSGGDIKFSPCCDVLYACYQTCGSPKSFCDDAFDKCNAKACGRDEKCHKEAEHKKMMKGFEGCEPYDKRQRESCECVEKDEAEQKRLAAIKYFYQKHAPNGQASPEDLAKKADSTAKMASLLRKLIVKYPKSIKLEKRKKTPQEEMMESIMKPAAEEDDDGEPDERVEL